MGNCVQGSCLPACRGRVLRGRPHAFAFARGCRPARLRHQLSLVGGCAGARQSRATSAGRRQAAAAAVIPPMRTRSHRRCASRTAAAAHLLFAAHVDGRGPARERCRNCGRQSKDDDEAGACMCQGLENSRDDDVIVRRERATSWARVGGKDRIGCFTSMIMPNGPRHSTHACNTLGARLLIQRQPRFPPKRTNRDKRSEGSREQTMEPT